MFQYNSSLLFITVLSFVGRVSSISCYKCSSINGSNPLCEDFYEGDFESRTPFLQSPCLTSLRGRQGLFPATHCIKLVVWTGGPQSLQYTYRTCSRDEGDDNDITHTNHCGFIKLTWISQHRQLRGCLDVCDKDACNRAHRHYFSIWKTFFLSLAFIYLLC